MNFLPLVVLCLFLAPFSSQSAITTPLTSNTPPMRIVTCPDGTDLDALIAEFNLKPRFIYRALSGFAAPMDAATVNKLKAHRCVLFVEDDGPVSLLDWTGQTNSTGLVRMGVDRFPVARINGLPKAPLDVDVAVIDSGIDLHPDLNVHHRVSMIDANVADAFGHGTLVAGILGAIDNDFGVAGVAPGVRLWSIKAISPNNTLWSNVTSAFSYVLQHSNRISVVSISILNRGSDAPVNALRLGLSRLVNAGIVVVACAGNDTNDLAGFNGTYGTGDDVVPASLPLVMAVSAIDPGTDQLTVFSNFSQVERTNNAYLNTTNFVFSPGGAIDVAAPGWNILTTAGTVNVGTNGGYMLATGTSFAAPHVAGLVALYIAANGRATNAAGVYRIRQAIIDASLPQSQWNSTNTMDPDTNPEPLAIASENWVPKPHINSVAGAPGNFEVGFDTVPGYDYTVRFATNLAPPIAWTDVATVTGSNFVSPVSVTDSNESSQSFYQLKRSPSQ